MSLPLILRSAARSEFDAAADWYESQQVGLGDRFIIAVQNVLSQIAADPLRYAVEYREVRGAQVSGFPYYCVYFRVRSVRVEVISIFHTSRDPSIWQSRV